jgi:hypothetical protein
MEEKRRREKRRRREKEKQREGKQKQGKRKVGRPSLSVKKGSSRKGNYRSRYLSCRMYRYGRMMNSVADPEQFDAELAPTVPVPSHFDPNF